MSAHSIGEFLTVLFLLLILLNTAEAETGSKEVQANCVAEVTLTSQKSYKDPFNELTLDAIVTTPAGAQLRVPAFWAGGNQWRFRYASAEIGHHTYRTECSDSSNLRLHGVKGVIDVVHYTGENPLDRHGPIRVASDRRHFEHADGTPFFWLGDTWWKGLCKRISFEGFQKLTADRKSKGFTVVQIVAGPYPDEPLFDPRWENEGGMPYEKSFARVNPSYFDFADKRFETLIDAGIVPAIVGSWGMHMPEIGVEKMKRHWRYLIARYGAYPVVWIVAGEAVDLEKWADVTRYTRITDPYHRMLTIHPPIDSVRKHFVDKAVVDFDMLSTGHGGWDVATRTVKEVHSSYAMEPPMPVLVGEVCYEGHMLTHWQDFQRYQFWTAMMNGAAGHTYGAGGIWQMNSENERGSEYEFTPWYEAMDFPGSKQVGMGKKLLEDYEWWRFQPHPEWTTTRGFTAGIPGEERFTYIPYIAYDWTPPTIRRIEKSVTFRASYWDPASGRRFDLGVLARPQADKYIIKDDFKSAKPSAWKDYGTPSLRGDGHLTGSKGMLTILEKPVHNDVTASVDASSDAEAGIVLRFQDTGNYLVGLYAPSLKAIYLHDRKNGGWGDQIGKVDVPDIGTRIHLTMAAYGSTAAMAISDGKNTYSTPTVNISNNSLGRAGLWFYQIGERQQFDNFELSQLKLPRIKSKPKWLPLKLGANPYVRLPAVSIPDISMLLTDSYTPPRLPAPQDWVLILERVKL